MADKYITYYGNILAAHYGSMHFLFLCLLNAIRRLVHKIAFLYLKGTLRLSNCCYLTQKLVCDHNCCAYLSQKYFDQTITILQ
jgi:hypothetical protein